MINRINNTDNFDYSKYNSMFPKEKLPQFENITIKPNNKTPDIIANKETNKADIQKMAKLLSESKSTETTDNKKVKVVSTAAKAENAKEDEEHNTSDKSTLKNLGTTLTKEGLYRYTGSKLLKPNPYLVAMSLLGVDFEEDGDALKKGAETGEIGDFKGDYKNFFKGMCHRASESDLKAAWEGFNLPANVISIGLQDCLQTAGVGLSKVIGKKTTEFLGSGVSTVGTAFNAIGDIAGDSVKGTVGIFKNLFTGDFDGVADSAKGIYNGAKDSVVDVANSVADFATDGADVVVDAAENVYDVAKDGANEVADAAKDVGNGVADVAEDAYDAVKDGANEVADAAKDVGNGVADAAEEVGDAVSDAAGAVGGAVSDAADAVGDAVSDAADAVGDFFDSIF